MIGRDHLVAAFELLFIPAIIVRGGANQFGYLWMTGEHPECKTTRELTADVPVELKRIQPWAVHRVHLSSTAFAIVLLFSVLWMFHLSVPGPDSMTFATLLSHPGPQSVLEWIAVATVGSQWLFVLLWDPLVLLTRGPAERAEAPTNESEGSDGGSPS